MSPDGSEQTRLTWPGPDFFPTWSPDGETVIFYSDEAGHGDLYRMAAEGRNKRRFLVEAPPAP